MFDPKNFSCWDIIYQNINYMLIFGKKASDIIKCSLYSKYECLYYLDSKTLQNFNHINK